MLRKRAKVFWQLVCMTAIFEFLSLFFFTLWLPCLFLFHTLHIMYCLSSTIIRIQSGISKSGICDWSSKDSLISITFIEKQCHLNIVIKKFFLLKVVVGVFKYFYLRITVNDILIGNILKPCDIINTRLKTWILCTSVASYFIMQPAIRAWLLKRKSGIFLHARA